MSHVQMDTMLKVHKRLGNERAMAAELVEIFSIWSKRVVDSFGRTSLRCRRVLSPIHKFP